MMMCFWIWVNTRTECNVFTMHTLQKTTLFLFGFLFYSCTSADCPLGSYSKNCSKLCHCRVGPCDGITGACGNGVCKDGWKGIACNETCPMESYSVNCSKQCHCLRGPCDGVSGECDKSGCKDGWTGIACNEKCGGVLTDPYGAITSPNYPWKYSRKNNCTWLINAPEGSRINVDFTDFELEKCKFCECDYLELFNGPTSSSPLVGKFCGTPNRFRSQSNSVRIVFTTDNTNIARGFRLTYTFSTQYDCPHGSYNVNCSKQCHCLVGPCDKVTGACENEVCEDGWKGKACNEKCGGVLTDPYGAITSPNYPWKYSRKNNCTWLINAPEGSRINVDFTDFELEKCKFCECDYLELFNGPTSSSPLVGKFCGTPNRFRSQSNSVRIVFTTDNTNIARGFRLTYTFSTQYDCPHGSYNVNCSKQCHCLVGPCDKVTGACENEVCEDGWKGKACNETKETTAAKPSTTDTISIPTTTTTSPTRNTASGTSPTTHVSIFTTERQHSHSEDSEKTHNPLFAATVTLSSVLGVVLVAVIICIVVFIRRRHRQSTGGSTANTESSPQQHYDDLLTSRDPGNYDYLQMPTCGQQGCTN